MKWLVLLVPIGQSVGRIDYGRKALDGQEGLEALERFRHFNPLQQVELFVVVGEDPGGPISEQMLPRLFQTGHVGPGLAADAVKMSAGWPADPNGPFLSQAAVLDHSMTQLLDGWDDGGHLIRQIAVMRLGQLKESVQRAETHGVGRRFVARQGSGRWSESEQILDGHVELLPGVELAVPRRAVLLAVAALAGQRAQLAHKAVGEGLDGRVHQFVGPGRLFDAPLDLKSDAAALLRHRGVVFHRNGRWKRREFDWKERNI